MRIVLLGPPGAGKGTQAVLLSKSISVPHISTGEMMREAVASGTELGVKVKGFLDRGQLVPDDVVIQVVRVRLGRPDCKPGFVLDGFPRTVNQAKVLTEILTDLKLGAMHVVELVVPESILIERIATRKADGGRSDDDEKVAAERIRVFREQTLPMIAYYKARGEAGEVDGVAGVEEVQDRILRAIGAKA